MKQRDMMRELFRRFRGDRARVVEAYVEAERRGDVERVSATLSLATVVFVSSGLMGFVMRAFRPDTSHAKWSGAPDPDR
jgi:hypothetical protein